MTTRVKTANGRKVGPTKWLHRQVNDPYVKKAKAEGKPAPRAPRAPDGPDAHYAAPMGLFNGMIAPLTPFTIRGAIWYQGESNAAKNNRGNMELYGQLFPTMILGWRYEFARAQGIPREDGEFPFLFVQLANYFPRRDEPTDSYWAQVREAQTGTLEVPRTGMAVAIDRMTLRELEGE